MNRALRPGSLDVGNERHCGLATVLAISSQVASGHVGLSAAVPALNALGHEVIVLPTIMLSNHPGHANVAGTRTPPETLAKMLSAIGHNGWLGTIDAILIGYLPSPEHVAFARHAITAVRDAHHCASPLEIVWDPVLGDHPKGLYIEEAAADAIRQSLYDAEHFAKNSGLTITPNVFELGWLTGKTLSTQDDCETAARDLPADVFVTSAPTGETDTLANLHVQRGGHGQPTMEIVARRRGVPHGTGDLFAALLLARHLDGRTNADREPTPLTFATRAVDDVIDHSVGADELALVARLPRIAELNRARQSQ